MEITWYGLSCFRLVERGTATVVTDPYHNNQAGFESLTQSADIITISHTIAGQPSLETKNGRPYLISGPGEYEVGGVFITGIQTGGQRAAEVSSTPSQNTLYVFDFDALTVAHLGMLDRALTQAEIEAIGTVNIALVPISSQYGLSTARAAELTSQMEPNIVIPMHYADPHGSPPPGIPAVALSKYLKELGLSQVEPRPSLKVTSTSLPEETQVIVLDYQRG